ncbi:MAG: ComEA family DNA-binding protein [Bacteroidales bacterium]
MSRHVSRVIVVVALILAAQAWLVAQKAQPAAAANTAAPAAAVINLNTATAEQLDSLPGIGPKVATRIIEYRQKNGPFKKIEDVMNVKGIGEKNFLKIKGRLTVGPAGKPAAPETPQR